MKITIYSIADKIVKSHIITGISENFEATYNYNSDKIIKNISGKEYIYNLKNGKISTVKIGESLLTFKYTDERLTEIERITGAEETKALIKWKDGNVAAIHTDDNYLGNTVILLNPSNRPNTIGIIPSLLATEFTHEIDLAMMISGYFGKCDEYLPRSLTYCFDENDADDILQEAISYNFDSHNQIIIQLDQNKDNAVSIKFIVK